MTEELKKISIRGRFAFCLACLHNAMQKEQVDSQSISVVLTRMNTFLYTKKLDEWEKEIIEVSPDTIFDVHPDNNFNEYETISAADLTRLKSVYEEMPVPIVKLIDYTINVGLSNLYGGTGEYSHQSLIPALEVVDLMINNDYQLPSLQEFVHDKFVDNNGWGFPGKEQPV